MADVLMNLIEQAPASGLAVGGALVAAAVGFTAVKAFGKTAPASANASAAQKKKKKTKTVKKKAEVDQAPAKQVEATPKINLDDFVSVRALLDLFTNSLCDFVRNVWWCHAMNALLFLCDQ